MRYRRRRRTPALAAAAPVEGAHTSDKMSAANVCMIRARAVAQMAMFTEERAGLDCDQMEAAFSLIESLCTEAIELGAVAEMESRSAAKAGK